LLEMFYHINDPSNQQEENIPIEVDQPDESIVGDDNVNR